MANKMNIPFSPPDITQEEIDEVAEALRSGWITTGPRVKELERQLAEYLGVKRCVCLNSQTACAEMALRVLGVGPGDEVIVPAYTYTASASVICHVGATPVMVDCAPDSLEMDYDAMAHAITERTKAVIPVDLGGVPCDYDTIFAALEAKRRLVSSGLRYSRGSWSGGGVRGRRPCVGFHLPRPHDRLCCRFHGLFLPSGQEFHDGGRRLSCLELAEQDIR